jgi:hypothetical protein
LKLAAVFANHPDEFGDNSQPTNLSTDDPLEHIGI